MTYRFATCNELFKSEPFLEVCKSVSDSGYQGLEIAPFTLGADPVSLTNDERTFLRKAMQNVQLEFVGLHWLLAAPEGLHATAKDEVVRRRTWTYVVHFVNLCADLAGSRDGNNGVVVFGSPKQRSSRDGMTSREATEVFIEGLGNAAAHAEARGVTLLVEALSPDQSDVVTSLAEAVSIVKQIGSPAVQTMFDVHNAVAETAAHTDLIREFIPYIKHIHVNELDGKEPGMGHYDFAALLKCLADVNYRGWVSLEAFDFSRDPREIIDRSIRHLNSSAPAMASA